MNYGSTLYLPGRFQRIVLSCFLCSSQTMKYPYAQVLEMSTIVKFSSALTF